MTTRDCLVEEAARLFASRGFAGTPVAEVQRACGLAPGSGALYKHFSSKEELFTAVIERALEENREYVARAEVLLSDNLEQTLRNMARGGLDALTRQRDVFRVLFRDADRFPELRDRFRNEGAQPVYAAFAMWLQAGIEDGRFRSHDAAAVSALLIGCLVNYRLVEALLGEPPGPVSEDRVIDAWVTVALALLTPGSR